MKIVQVTKDSWVIKQEDSKQYGLLTKFNGVYSYLKDGICQRFKTNQIQNLIPRSFLRHASKEPIETDLKGFIDGYPVNYSNYVSVDGDHGRPVFKKSRKSHILYCAGYYLIKFEYTWVLTFCPKLITINKYEHNGPLVTKEEAEEFIQNSKK